MNKPSIISQYNLMRQKAISLLPKEHPLYKQLMREDIADAKPDTITLADAELYLVAAQRSIKYKQYKVAIVHLNRGIEKLGNNAWEHSYDLIVELCVELGKVENLSTNFLQSLEIAETIIENSQSHPELIQGYELKILTLGILSRREEAISSIFKLFEIINFSLDKVGFSEVNIAQLQSLPEIQEDWKVSLLGIIKMLGELAYTTQPELCISVGFTEIRFCIDNGKSPLYLQCFADYALLLTCYFDTIELGYKLGQLAVDNLTNGETELSKPAVLEIFNGHIRFWKEHIRKSIEQLEQAFRSGIEVRDFMMAGVAAIVRCDQMRVAGMGLAIIREAYLRYLDTFSKMNLEYPKPYASVGMQFVLNLMGISEETWVLRGEAFDEEIDLPKLIEHCDYSPVFLAYLAKTQLNYFFGNAKGAIENASIAEQYRKAAAGLVTNVEHNFYESLALLAHYSNVKLGEQAKILEKVQVNQEQLKKWAEHAPMNFQHKYLLVEAERKRIGKDFDAALADYQQAKELAAANGFIQDTAIVNELLGKVYLALKEDGLGKKLIAAAYEGYIAWGAIAVAERLAIEFPSLVSNTVQARDAIDLPEQWIAVKFAKDVGSALDDCRITYFRLSKTLVLDFPSNDLMLAAWRQDVRKMVKAAKAIGDLVQHLKLTSPEASWEPFSVSKFKPF